MTSLRTLCTTLWTLLGTPPPVWRHHTAPAWWAGWSGWWRERWEPLRREPEAGYSTETVVVTALLVVLALVVLGIIAVAVTAKANSITL